MRRREKIGDELDRAGIALAGADLAIAQPSNRYAVPAEFRIADASEFRSPIITSPGPRRPAWPWLPSGQPVLAYRWGGDGERRASPANQRCLDEFIGLADISDEKLGASVLRFAKRWGPLEICEHGKPFRHYSYPDRCISPRSPANSPWCNEPLEAWRRYSRHLGSFLRVAANLHQGIPGSPEDWNAIAAAELSDISRFARENWGNVEMPENTSKSRRVASELGSLAFGLRNWFRYGGVELFPKAYVQREHRQISLDTSYWGLPGKLAVELAAALSSPNGVYQCAGCGNGFASENRKRSQDRNKWCERPECKAEQFRRNSRRCYAKQKKVIKA